MPGVHNGIKGDGKKPPRLMPSVKILRETIIATVSSQNKEW
jgi:hypothetical protein